MTEGINFAILGLRFGESRFSPTVALVVGSVSFVCLEENSPFLVSISFSRHGIAAVLLQGLQSKPLNVSRERHGLLDSCMTLGLKNFLSKFKWEYIPRREESKVGRGES
jgi:hypothetical protein